MTHQHKTQKRMPTIVKPVRSQDLRLDLPSSHNKKENSSKHSEDTFYYEFIANVDAKAEIFKILEAGVFL